MKWFDLHNQKQPVYHSGNPSEQFSETMEKGKEPIKITFLRIPIDGIKKLFRRLFR